MARHMCEKDGTHLGQLPRRSDKVRAATEKLQTGQTGILEGSADVGKDLKLICHNMR